MAEAYKLTNEINNFIISRKKADPRLSCRGLVSSIEQEFAIKLSKSLINRVIKQNKLNSPVGRRRIKPIIQIANVKEEPVVQPDEFTRVIKNGGYLFLKIADLKLSLTYNLAESFLVYFPQLSLPALQSRIEFLIYSRFFEDKDDLWLIIGGKCSFAEMCEFTQTLEDIPLAELSKILIESGFIDSELKETRELYKQCLVWLNSYVQNNFFTLSCPSFDLTAMRERFYSLSAQITRKEGVLAVKFMYPRGFCWENDELWQKDFSCAVNKIHQDKVYNGENAQFLIDTQLIHE